MGMDSKEYTQALETALNARHAWLEKTEFPKLKEEFRIYHASFAAIYKALIQKRLIHEDPYKQEARVGEIKVPPPFMAEGDRMDQLTMNLSAYDNQLDFLVNFFQFSVDFLTMENIKRILALVKYIDWTHFAMDTQSANTKVLVDLVAQVRTGGDPLGIKFINESLDKLKKATGVVLGYLKEAAQFNREDYKFELRRNITEKFSAQEASVENIKKRFGAAMPGKPFYPDLADEVIKEDFSPGGEKLKENILQQLSVPENKPKTVQKQVSFKATLLDGLMIISSVALALGDIAPRMDENNLVFQNRKQSFMEKVKEAFRKMLNKEPEPVIYEIEYIDTAKGIPVKEHVNFNIFRTDLEKKIRSFSSLGGRGGASTKLEAMDEKQLLEVLGRAVRDAQVIQKTLTGLDEFFKAEAPKEDRDRIKGIKPELGTIKNAIIKANQKRHEYSAQLEEDEQLKRLGVKPQ
jgi:hypothetical protein